jgi:hypothetical protein
MTVNRLGNTYHGRATQGHFNTELNTVARSTKQGHLTWSKHVDTTVAKMGRSLSIIKRFSAFLTTLSTRQVLQALVSTFLATLLTRQVQQALVLSHLDYCSVVWSGVTKRDLGK